MNNLKEKVKLILKNQNCEVLYQGTYLYLVVTLQFLNNSKYNFDLNTDILINDLVTRLEKRNIII